ncbi:MAG: inositol monophosphatase family protein [Actinomycetes bacterium]
MVTRYVGGVEVADLLELLSATADAVADALAADQRSTPAGGRDKGDRPGQYRIDLVADAAALRVLRNGGVGVLSEESGFEHPDADVVVVVDPIDGSTNASRGLPWCATSLCAVDAEGPLAALVRNLVTGTEWRATRGGGATCDGMEIRPSATTDPGAAVVVLNGFPPAHLGWRQYRALGATALDLCAVADGSVDATVDCAVDALGPWDYLGSSLVLREAGAVVADLFDRDLGELGHHVRRTPISAATPELLEALRANLLTARST